MSSRDWSGDKNSVFKTLGASNHTDEERQREDYYATDPIAIDVLLGEEANIDIDKHIPVWECACGEGHLSKRLEEYGFKVYSTDLIDRGYGKGDVDFFKITDKWGGNIITNPPYKYAKEFVEQSMELLQDGNKCFMFLRLLFLEGKARKELFKKYPPKCVYVTSSRILCAKNAKFDEMKAGGGGAVAYAWYEFEKGYKGETKLKWIN